jgi:hypothetical protein
MSGVEETAGATAKTLEVLKDLPLWLLAGLAISAAVLVKVPSLPTSARPWVIIAGVVFGVLTAVRGAALLVEWMRSWKKGREERKRFHLTADPQQNFWSSAKQGDGSIVTQVVTRLAVKNLTDEPIGLAHVRLLKPKIPGEIVHEDVSVRAVGSNLYGTAAQSGHVIPPRTFLPASASVLVRGVPRWKLGSEVDVKIAITDDEGHQQRLQLKMRVLSASATVPARPAIEMVSSLSNPVEKEVATVLQAELSRYEKCGRRVGGLGSVHFALNGMDIVGVGNDGWNSNSATNQSISDNPDTCEIRSDNVEALMAFYERLSLAEKDQFAAALLARMDKGAYLAVSYFIVLVLWRIGRLREALEAAKSKLPQGEIGVFGLSNVPMLLNGLLRNRYPEFTNEMLDDIERFLDGLNEHPFQIPEKLAAIRTARLLRPKRD